MTTINEFSTPSDNEIKIVRSFASPREQVWAAFTQARHLRRWWGPEGFTTPICQVDFRPGGSWFYCFEDADGQRYCGKLLYSDIEAPRRFTGVDVFTDEDGRALADLPQAQVSYEFAKAEGATIVSNVSR